MQMPNVKIEGAAGKGDIRSYLREPYLDVDNKRIIAADGHIAAIVPILIDEGDTSGHISADAIVAARKSATARSRPDKLINIKANGSLTLDNNASFPRNDLGKFVDIDRVIAPKSHDVISLNAKLLLNLAQAICLQGEDPIVTLHLTEDRQTGAIRVERFAKKGDAADAPFGMIMPVRNK